MPLAYSEDLQLFGCICTRRLLLLIIACFLYISAYRYVEHFMTTGEVRKCRKTNCPAATCILSEYEELIIVNSVLSLPGIYLRELQQQLSQSTGRWVYESAICRCLRQLGMTRQKSKHITLQRSDCKRAEFIANVMMFFDPTLCV